MILGVVSGKCVIDFQVKYQCLRVEIMIVDWAAQVESDLSLREYV
jgi:hypothetical protein